MTKRITLLSVFLIFLAVNSAYSQVKFQKTFGGTGSDQGNCVEQTSDGGFIIAGQTSRFFGGEYDIYLIKTDGNGDQVWAKTYGGTDDDHAQAVCQTADGGYIVTGSSKSFPGLGGSDVYIVRTNGVGDTLWTKLFGTAANDVGNSIQQTSDGGFIIGGAAEIGNYLLLKIDSAGTEEWTKIYQCLGQVSEVQQTYDGGYIMTGGKFQLIKTDNWGDTIWTKRLNTNFTAEAYSVQQTTDSGYIIAGKGESFGVGSSNAFLIKTYSNGDTLWTKRFGGATGQSEFRSIRQTVDGGYIAVGMTNSFSSDFKIFVVKFDFNANPEWSNIYGSSSYNICYSIRECSDNGFIFTGSFNDQVNDSCTVILVKTDENGVSGCFENPAAVIMSSAQPVKYPIGLIINSGISEKYVPTIVDVETINATLCTSIGVIETKGRDNLEVFPNPSDGTFTIRYEEFTDNALIRIYDMTGSIISEQIFSNNKLSEFRNISSGIYLVKINTNDKVVMGKIVIR